MNIFESSVEKSPVRNDLHPRGSFCVKTNLVPLHSTHPTLLKTHIALRFMPIRDLFRIKRMESVVAEESRPRADCEGAWGPSI